MSLPFSKTWWINEGHLLGGCYPGTKDPHEQERMIEALLQVGVTRFISLQERHETGAGSTPFPDYMPIAHRLSRDLDINVGFDRFPIRDQSTASVQTIAATLDSIDIQMQEGRTVYIHCWGGNGRTGTIAGCWLIRHGMTPDQALVDMQQKRLGRGFTASAPENETQREVVRNWDSLDPRVRGTTDAG